MDRIEVMKDVVREAGEFVLGAQHLREHTEKSGVKDFVTLADIKSQEIIRERLTAAFPEAVILSEEDPEDERQALFQPDFTGFVVDPIDGTYNFKRDMRKSCISIGYIKNGKPVTGAVYDPYLDELYEAEQGKGARLNGKIIQVSDQTDLAGASISTGNSYNDAAMERNLRRQLGIYEQTGIMPWLDCLGTAVLIMSYIACGRVNAYHHNGLKPWDTAAAFLIVREAGGVVINFYGEEAGFTELCAIVANPALAELLQSTFVKLDPKLLT